MGMGEHRSAEQQGLDGEIDETHRLLPRRTITRLVKQAAVSQNLPVVKMSEGAQNFLQEITTEFAVFLSTHAHRRISDNNNRRTKATVSSNDLIASCYDLGLNEIWS